MFDVQHRLLRASDRKLSLLDWYRSPLGVAEPSVQTGAHRETLRHMLGYQHGCRLYYLTE